MCLFWYNITNLQTPEIWIVHHSTFDKIFRHASDLLESQAPFSRQSSREQETQWICWIRFVRQCRKDLSYNTILLNNLQIHAFTWVFGRTVACIPGPLLSENPYSSLINYCLILFKVDLSGTLHHPSDLDIVFFPTCLANKTRPTFRRVCHQIKSLVLRLVCVHEVDFISPTFLSMSNNRIEQCYLIPLHIWTLSTFSNTSIAVSRGFSMGTATRNPKNRV